MKKIITLSAAVAMAFVIQSCGNAPKDSTAKADSTNLEKDSADKKHPATVGQEISGDDAKFAVAAANGGMAEVALGELAGEKGLSEDVRQFGAMMVKDHSKINADLKALANSKHIVLPDSLNNEEKELKATLSKKSGSDFDKAYVQAMLEDHQKDTTEFAHAAKIVKYPEMSAFINKALPVIKMHLAEIQKIHNKMK